MVVAVTLVVLCTVRMMIHFDKHMSELHHTVLQTNMAYLTNLPKIFVVQCFKKISIFAAFLGTVSCSLFLLYHCIVKCIVVADFEEVQHGRSVRGSAGG